VELFSGELREDFSGEREKYERVGNWKEKDRIMFYGELGNDFYKFKGIEEGICKHLQID
jgi:hypothetical protein